MAPAMLSAIAPMVLGAGQGLMGGKGGRDPNVIGGFEGFPPAMMQMLNNALGIQAPFLNALPGLSNVGAGIGAGNARNAIGGSLIGSAFGGEGGDIFSQGIDSLSQGLQSGFGNVPIEALGRFEELLRPTAERSKDILQSDVMERGAATGQARSSGTVESLTRGFSDIENNLGSNVANISAQLTPGLIQGQLGGIGQALGVPDLIRSFLNDAVSQAMGGTQFALGLPGQAAGQLGGLGGIPVDAGSEGKGGGGAMGK